VQSLLHQSIKLGAGLAETYINMNEFRYTGREEFIKSVEKIILSTSKSKKITTEKKNLVKSLQDLVNEHLKKTSESYDDDAKNLHDLFHDVFNHYVKKTNDENTRAILILSQEETEEKDVQVACIMRGNKRLFLEAVFRCLKE